MSALVIREAAPSDEAELLRMMRALAEQEPGKIKFDEPAARTAFRKFSSLPAFGRVWLLCEANKPVGYIVLTLGFSGNEPAAELYRRAGYEDHHRFLMTKWLNRE